MDNTDSTTHAYYNFFMHQDHLRRYVSQNPKERDYAVRAYMESLVDALNKSTELQDVLLGEMRNMTGIQRTGYDAFYQLRNNGSYNKRVDLGRTQAIALSLIALEASLDMQYDSAVGKRDFLHVEEEAFRPEFVRKASAYYTVKTLRTVESKAEPEKEEYAAKKKDEARGRQGSHTSGEIVVVDRTLEPAQQLKAGTALHLESILNDEDKHRSLLRLFAE